MSPLIAALIHEMRASRPTTADGLTGHRIRPAYTLYARLASCSTRDVSEHYGSFFAGRNHRCAVSHQRISAHTPTTSLVAQSRYSRKPKTV